MIIDASVILSALFPDEQQSQSQAIIRDHVAGQISLVGPTLLEYELSNAVWQGVRRQRITMQQAEEIMTVVDELHISLQTVKWQTILPWAQKFDRSAYDAAYVALAAERNESLVTGDLRLYNAVHQKLDWVLWIGNYQSQTLL